MSQAVGKPVRVQFMRWDEHGWDQFGPAQATDVRAGIDAAGNLVAYDYTAYNHGWTQVVESAAELAGTPLPAAPGGQVDTVASGLVLQDPEPARDEQGRQRLRRVPEGHLAAGAGRSAGGVRLGADDRRARPRGEHGPDRRSGSRTSTRPR